MSIYKTGNIIHAFYVDGFIYVLEVEKKNVNFYQYPIMVKV
jgi:hypothetical protein